MKSFIGTLVFMLVATSVLSQEHSYSFSGDLSTTTKEKLEKRVSSIEGIEQIKCRYKEDSGRGELIFIVLDNPERRKEQVESEYSPTLIKAILIEFDLSPINYRELTK